MKLIIHIVLVCILIIIILGFSKVLADPIVPPVAPMVVQVKKVLTIREKVQIAFGSTSPMMAVVQCESGFQQFKEGAPLQSPTSDIGVMQINQVHWQEAEKLGLDIFNSVDDNIKMGQIVLEKQGLTAWSCYK